MNILQHFPYKVPRPGQRDLLLQLEKDWDSYSVFVLVMPTSSGKTAIAKTLASWQNSFNKSVRITTPNNLLVQQYTSEFPDLPALIGNSNYVCKTYQEYSCKQRNSGCTGCPLRKAQTEFYDSDVQLTNNHLHASMLSRNKYHNAPDVFISDEAHNLIQFQRDINSLYLWKHKGNYPWKDESPNQLLSWLDRQPKWTASHRALQDALTAKLPQYTLDHKHEGVWKGGGYDTKNVKMVRGEEYDLPQLRIVPIDISMMTDTIVPSRTKKIVLMSSTIGQADIQALGLSKRRVRYLECRHPIPTQNRPIVLDYQTTINNDNLISETEKLCKYIMTSGILHTHAGEKGVIHMTYAQSTIARKYLTDKRFMFHTNLNKREIYDAFMASEPTEGKVLVACGMYEGLDFVEDLGRWQIIAKIPWPSLGDPVVKYHIENPTYGNRWYQWQTLKTVIQGAGRISRTENDYGVTYITDGTFSRLIDSPDLPTWFTDAIV